MKKAEYIDYLQIIPKVKIIVGEEPEQGINFNYEDDGEGAEIRGTYFDNRSQGLYWNWGDAWTIGSVENGNTIVGHFSGCIDAYVEDGEYVVIQGPYSDVYIYLDIDEGR